MTQLNLWNKDYYNQFIDTSQSFNKAKYEKINMDWREIPKDSLAYKSIEKIRKEKSEIKKKEEKTNKFYSLCEEILLPEKHSEALFKIANRRDLFEETLVALKQVDGYKELMEQYHKMRDDPYLFYIKNKTINNLENKILTYGSLSLSYSFCSPYGLVSTIIENAKYVKEYHNFILETSDEKHELEEALGLNDFFNSSILNKKYESFIQDFRGNKVPSDLITELQNQIKFDKRSNFDDSGLGTITKESLMDSFYIFFGSKLGTEFIERWKRGENKEELKKEFENDIYENPYVNLSLINLKLKDFGTENHLASAKDYLGWKKKYPGRNMELDFGLNE